LTFDQWAYARPVLVAGQRVLPAVVVEVAPVAAELFLGKVDGPETQSRSSGSDSRVPAAVLDRMTCDGNHARRTWQRMPPW